MQQILKRNSTRMMQIIRIVADFFFGFNFFNAEFVESLTNSRKALFFIFLLLLCNFCLWASSYIDSLKAELIITQEDTTKINILNKISQELSPNNPQQAINYAKKALSLSKKLKKQKLIANSYQGIAYAYYLQSNFPKSLEISLKALEIRKQLNDKEKIASSLSNIGNIYMDQGDYPNALKHFFEALAIDKMLGNKNNISKSIGSIGIVYWNQGKFTNALKYYVEALELAKEVGNKFVIELCLGNIGNVYNRQGDYKNALTNYLEALNISKELGIKIHIAAWLGNIGLVYFNQDDYNNAFKYFFEYLNISKELGIKQYQAIALSNIGSAYTKQKKFNEAEGYLKEALILCDSLNILNEKMQVEKIISDELYAPTNRFQLAYEHYKKYSIAKDSLFNEEKSKEIGRIEMRHEFEMAEIERIRIMNDELRMKSEKIKRRNMLQYSGIVLGMLVLFMIVFLLAGRFRKINQSVIASPDSSGTWQSHEKSFFMKLPFLRLDTHEGWLRSFLARNNEKLLEAVLFVSFLIFFEFILVLLDPYVEQITDGEPAWKLLVNAVLAGTIFPLHNFLEAKLKARVMRKEAGIHVTEKKSESKTLLMLLGFLFISFFNISFSDKADSLKTLLANAKEDTSKVVLINALGKEIMYGNPDSSILLGKKSLAILNAIVNEGGEKQSIARSNLIANSHSSLGVYYYLKGDYPQSLLHHHKALDLKKQLNHKQGIAISLNNIGIIYHEQGDYPNTLKLYLEALEINKSIGNKIGIASGLGNIGIVYWNQGEYTNALKYYHEALEIDKEIGNKNGIARWLSNIGLVYRIQGDYPNALKYYYEALELDKAQGRKSGIATRLGNIGFVYKEQGDNPNALKFYSEALKIDKELGNKNGIARHLGNIGTLYTKLGRYKDAEVYLDSALVIFDTIGALSFIAESHQNLSQLYDTTGRYKLAYEHYKKYSTAKDSIFSEEKSKEIGRIEQKHEFEMAKIENERIKNEELRIRKEETKRVNTLQYTAIFISIFLFFALALLFVRLHLPGWIIKLSVFILFLLIFEFTLVLIDPYIEAWTGGAPAYKLLINAALAGLIFPVHGWMENILKKLLIRKLKIAIK